MQPFKGIVLSSYVIYEHLQLLVSYYSIAANRLRHQANSNKTNIYLVSFLMFQRLSPVSLLCGAWLYDREVDESLYPVL